MRGGSREDWTASPHHRGCYDLACSERPGDRRSDRRHRPSEPARRRLTLGGPLRGASSQPPASAVVLPAVDAWLGGSGGGALRRGNPVRVPAVDGRPCGTRDSDVSLSRSRVTPTRFVSASITARSGERGRRSLPERPHATRAQVVDLIEGRRFGAVLKHSLEGRDCFVAQTPAFGRGAHRQLPMHTSHRTFAFRLLVHCPEGAARG